MQVVERIRERFEVAGQLMQFLWERRLWWMIPMVVILLAFGGLLVAVQGSAIAPFIYTLF